MQVEWIDLKEAMKAVEEVDKVDADDNWSAMKKVEETEI